MAPGSRMRTPPIVMRSPDVLLRVIRGEDLLEAVLNDDIRLEGNLNYVCKFYYMATDLRSPLGLMGRS